jgi:hypothetical protein
LLLLLLELSPALQVEQVAGPPGKLLVADALIRVPRLGLACRAVQVGVAELLLEVGHVVDGQEVDRGQGRQPAKQRGGLFLEERF